jgi:26S proteasome regulatory subunit N9
MALIEAVFKRPPHARRLRFSDVATETRLPVEEVEHLTMKALSLSLIRGRIDQVDGIVEIDWVQPRYLEKQQIAAMREQLEDWQRTVEHTAAMVESAAPEIFVRSS